MHLPPAAAAPLPAGTDATGSEECAELGCCWSFPSPLRLEDWQPDVYQPACYAANGGNSSYAVVNATTADLIESGFYGATCSAVLLLSQTKLVREDRHWLHPLRCRPVLPLRACWP